MKNYGIVLGFMMTAHIVCMQQEMSILPRELIFKEIVPKDEKCTRFTMQRRGFGETLAVAWTIAPTLLKFCTNQTPLSQDLSNPQDGEAVLVNTQLWCTRSKLRLSEDIRRTDDITHMKASSPHGLLVFDGINKCDQAVYTCKYNPDKPDATYSLYMLTQSKEFGKNTNSENHQPMLEGKGTLTTLMLEKERNRIMYSVAAGDLSSCQLYIKDIVENVENPLQGALQDVAFLESNLFFKKTACLEKDTYFGITDDGKLYCIWLNEDNVIEYAEQKFSSQPHRFTDISVDNTVSTEKGYKPNIAFLTDKGDIYITHLGAFEQPTLLYVRTVESPEDVLRLYYNDSKLIIVYKSKNDVLEFQDNFVFLYLSVLYKKLNKDLQ